MQSNDEYSEIKKLITELSGNGPFKAGVALRLSAELFNLVLEGSGAAIDVSNENLVHIVTHNRIAGALFSNEKSKNWVRKDELSEDEPWALQLFESDEIEVEAKFYLLAENATKAVTSALVTLIPNWEDSNACTGRKVGIDFMLSKDENSLLMIVSKRGKLRVLEFENKLSNTQHEILDKIKGAAAQKSKESIHAVLWDAFALKEVNKKFYVGIAERFNVLVSHLESSGRDRTQSLDFANRLIGRILFIWFLRKLNKINNKIAYFDVNGQSSTDYYNTKLKPLFFNTLNQPKDSEDRPVINGVKDDETPFLNGGLFEARDDDWVSEVVDFPENWFCDLFEFFDEYNFTTDESTPEYEQVAIDPEMLGRVFENLLASLDSITGSNAREASGSYYTPRDVVSFMCKETLREHLYEQLGREGKVGEGIDKLLDCSDADFEREHSNFIRDLFGEKNAKRMVKEVQDALKDIRILDPACGSGAFPMGMMQLLLKTHLRLNKSLNVYEKKLEILKENIFGVDIQPMAVEISKLRAWLSLEIDNANNETLPNLTFKFICANSLVSLPEEKSKAGASSIYGENLIDGRGQLASILKKYYSASTHEQKEGLRKYYEECRESMVLRKSNMGPGSGAELLLKWDPWNLSTPAPFFEPNDMFSIESFDCVIGNPPYVQIQTMSNKEKELYKSQNFKTFQKTSDIYCLFYERAKALLKQKGICSFITSNTWMTTGYGKKLRDWFLEEVAVKMVLDLGNDVFEAAAVSTNILIYSNEKPLLSVNMMRLRELDSNIELSEFCRKNSNPMPFSKGQPWVVLSTAAEKSIKEKVDALGSSLDNWDIRTNRGILTGYNPAFIIDGDVKEELIKEDSKSAEILKPILRGRDIHRFSYDFADKWLIAAHNGYVNGNNERIPYVKIEDYPAIKAWLDSSWERISKREDRGNTPYNLRNCAFIEDFGRQKICWKAVGRNLAFSIVEAGFFLSAPANFLILNSEDEEAMNYTLGILLSSLAKYQIYTKSDKTGEGDIMLNIQSLCRCVLKEFVGLEEQLAISNAVSDFRLKKISIEQTDAIIDEQVAKMYDFTEEEKKFLSEY